MGPPRANEGWIVTDRQKGNGFDYGQLTIDALKRYHNNPGYMARNKK